MKFLFLLFFVCKSYAISSQPPGNAYVSSLKPSERALCIPPSLSFFENKLRESYQFNAGEKELLMIVKDQKNYALREDVKSLKRKLMFAKRKDVPLLVSELQAKFDQMINNVDTESVITNFPMEGGSAIVSSSTDGSIMISMKDLNPGSLDFIPSKTLKKLEKNVKIQYKYPYDSFDYFLTFEGEELPIAKAVQKIGEEFETSCIVQQIENGWTRDGEKRMRQVGKGSTVQ